MSTFIFDPFKDYQNQNLQTYYILNLIPLNRYIYNSLINRGQWQIQESMAHLVYRLNNHINLTQIIKISIQSDEINLDNDDQFKLMLILTDTKYQSQSIESQRIGHLYFWSLFNFKHIDLNEIKEITVLIKNYKNHKKINLSQLKLIK